MTKEISEKKNINPLIYILGIPFGIYILVLSYNAWEKDRLFRECSKNINFLGNTQYSKSPTFDGFVPQDTVPNCLHVLGR